MALWNYSNMMNIKHLSRRGNNLLKYLYRGSFAQLSKFHFLLIHIHKFKHSIYLNSSSAWDPFLRVLQELISKSIGLFLNLEFLIIDALNLQDEFDKKNNISKFKSILLI